MTIASNQSAPLGYSSPVSPGLSSTLHLPVSRLLAYAVLVGFSYYLLARLGLAFLSNKVGVAAVWPANGVTLAALLLLPRRAWAVLLLSGFVGNVLANVFTDRTPAEFSLYSAVNVAEVLAAALFMRWAHPKPLHLKTTREVILFTVFACAGGGLFGGALGSACVHFLRHPADSFIGVWRFWAVVDAIGLMTITPTIISIIQHRPFWQSKARLVEKVLCLATFTAATYVMFEGGPGHRTLLFNLPYVTLLPFMLWAGLRFDVRASSLLTVILVSIGAWSTVNGYGGPFRGRGYPEGEAIIAFQISALFWGLSALVLSSVTAERRSAAVAIAESEARAREAESAARFAETQARAAEHAALESHARVQGIFDNAESVIYMKDLSGRYVAINRAFERGLKLKAADVIGKTDFELFPSDMAGRFRIQDELLIREGRTVEYESESTLDGARGIFWTVKFPIRDATGQITAICGISTDVTARKRGEEELKTAKETAEQNAARAEALAWRAEAANRAKTEFLANISHEIRTPLTAIFGYAELLLSPSLTTSQRIENVQTIRRNGEHLLSILNDVLDMSKIEAGRMTVERVATQVPQIISEVMSLMQQRANEKELSLSVHCRTPVPVMILSDPTRLRQILINIVGNAIKFTEAGRVVVEIAVDDANGSELTIDVADSGIGMTPEQVASLGEPFTQGDPSHARRFGGSGLGLSISYRLAQLMGGSISCKSEVNIGSTFSLRLPTGDLGDVPRVNQLSDLTEAPPAVADPHSMVLAGRVLIAEDAADTRRLLLTYLRRTGITVETVENGQAAVAYAVAAWRSNRPFDLILMDLQMPQMDGLTATSMLRSHGYPGRIVALTANAMDHDRNRCMTAGCDGFLTKPIRAQAFLAAVRDHIAAGRGMPPADANTAPVAVASDDTCPPPAAPATDGRIASELANDPDVGPLLDEYLIELRQKATAVAQAASEGDWSAMARLAHQIKGSAGGYGYPALSESARLLERAARTPDAAATVRPLVAELIDLCGRATRQ